MNKLVFIIICIIFISVAYSFDANKGYHTINEISRGIDSSSIDSYDSDFNFVPDTIVDFADQSDMAFYLVPDIDPATICTNESNTCDSRFYLRGSAVLDADLFNGLDINDFCLADKTTCPDAYVRCDQQGACENVYVSRTLDILSCSFNQDWKNQITFAI